jgi:hypothetical protein
VTIVKEKRWYLQAAEAMQVSLHRHTANQYVGPCPFCGEGVDRFVVWQLGNYWCRQCDARGWWKEGDIEEARLQAEKRQRREEELRAELRKNTDWMDWRDNLHNSDEGMALCEGEGLRAEDLLKFHVGLTDDYRGAPALTFPVFVDGVLTDIRMRRLDRTPEGLRMAQSSFRYCSYYPGTSAIAYNLDSINKERRILIVEGEKKTIICSRVWGSVIGIPGARTFAKTWPEIQARLRPVQAVILGFDPDAVSLMNQAADLVMKSSGIGVYLSYWPLKPDDFFLKYGKDLTEGIIRGAEKCV